MSVRLCEDCCQWIWSKNDCCPDCGSSVSELRDPQAVSGRLRNTIGSATEQLGHVRVVRRKLPTDGMLFATEHGLFFLPHRTVTAQRLIEENHSSILFRMAATCFAPLALLLPFVKSKRLTVKTVEEQEPIRLTKDRWDLLPDLLPRMPGALFLAAREVLKVINTRKRWTFQRLNGSQLKIDPLAPDVFEQRLQTLLATEKWRSITESP